VRVLEEQIDVAEASEGIDHAIKDEGIRLQEYR